MVIDILELLDKPIAYQVVFARITGSVTVAVFLSQAFYWQRNGKQSEDGWWYHTQFQWTAETGLSRREQETARKKLCSLGILDECRKGMPSKVQFKLNYCVLIEKIKQYQQIARNRQTSMAEPVIQDCTNPPSLSGGNRHIPETIPETKLETTTTNDNSSDIKEYIAQGMLYGGQDGKPPRNPEGWKIAVQKRLQKQGGLLEVDMSQLAMWRGIHKRRRDVFLVQEQENKKQAAEDQRAVDQLQAALKAFETLPQSEREKIESKAISRGVSQDGPLWPSTIAAIVQTWSISQ